MTDTSRLVFKGLKKASGETDFGRGPYSGLYTEIFYNKKSGDIITRQQASFGHNSWTEFDDPDIIGVCNADSRMTMKEIKDAVIAAVEQGNENEREAAAAQRQYEKDGRKASHALDFRSAAGAEKSLEAGR